MLYFLQDDKTRRYCRLKKDLIDTNQKKISNYVVIESVWNNDFTANSSISQKLWQLVRKERNV